jgi:hypothetical protein
MAPAVDALRAQKHEKSEPSRPKMGVKNAAVSFKEDAALDRQGTTRAADCQFDARQ